MYTMSCQLYHVMNKMKCYARIELKNDVIDYVMFTRYT